MKYKLSDPTTWPEGLAEALPECGRAAAADGHLAKRFGLTYTQVRHLRSIRGCGAAPRPAKLESAHVALVGKVPDAELARLAGVTKQAIHRRRKRAGIGRKPAKVSESFLAP